MSMLIDAYRFGSAPPPPGNFPVRLSVTQTVVTPASATHNIAMPATVSAGDLLIVVIGTSTTSAMTTPSGWTLLGTATNSVRSSIFYKVAAGTEGGTTVNFATGGSTGASAQVFRYQAGTFTGTPEVSTVASGSSVSPDPGSVSPSGGSGDYAVIAYAGTGFSSGVTTTAFPLPSGQLVNTPINPANMCATCYEDANGSSFNPGAFTISSSTTWTAWTIALKGT